MTLQLMLSGAVVTFVICLKHFFGKRLGRLAF
ncbi:hypothetical protein GGQ71_003151 [Rhizobium taibaishanense]|uniref:Uncharacterized protein n=1 Tax=Allorhizobium taibaishanense TaxID=887144 RepID=A0A7W6HP53_9HYPH|nr:hypothetical protein [Allorhizobium taibaishanense]